MSIPVQCVVFKCVVLSVRDPNIFNVHDNIIHEFDIKERKAENLQHFLQFLHELLFNLLIDDLNT